MNDPLLLNCPHCEGGILVHINEINCAIFRHGIYTNSYQQMNPHESKNNCDWLKESNEIIGCGKPFKIDRDQEGEYITIKCPYI